MPSPAPPDYNNSFIIEEIEVKSRGTSASHSNAATPPDQIDQAFQECLVAAEAATEFQLPLPPHDPTPFWSSTPLTGDCFNNNLLSATLPWTSNATTQPHPIQSCGLITPTTGQIPMSSYPSLEDDNNNINLMSVPLPQSTWPPALGMDHQGQYQYLNQGYQGTYNTAQPSASPEQIPRAAYTAPTSPQTFGPGPDRTLGYLPHSRKRSATINTTSTLQSGSPSMPPQSNYPYPNHRPDLSRQPSTPAMSMSSFGMTIGSEGQTKKVYHPVPTLHPSHSSIDLTRMTYPDGVNLGASGGMLFHPQQYGFGDGFGYGGEVKPARFKPTKEQLDILIRSYNENKNPDAATREALAKQLGPDVKPKTLQIWFQNRRSKSRAKEREANLPKRLDMKGRTTPPGRGGSMNIKRTVDVEALRQLVHDDDPSILLIPITVLSIASWTRFLTPGIGYTLPDLGCSVSLSPSPVINLYVVHKSETFKVVVPINPQTISNIQGTSNPVLNTDAVAMKFDLAPGCAQFMGWHKGMDGVGGWQGVGDFTSGEAGNGGKVEITGEKSALLNAFTRIHGLLESLPTPLASARSAQSQGHFGNLSQTWNFPNTASTFGEFLPPLSAPGSQGPLTGCNMDFLSLNPPAAQANAGAHIRHQSLTVSGAEFKHPGLTPRHHSTRSVSHPSQPTQEEPQLDQLLGLPWTQDEFTVPPPQTQSPEQWVKTMEAPAQAPAQQSHTRNLSVQSGTSGASLGSLGFSQVIPDKMYEFDTEMGQKHQSGDVSGLGMVGVDVPRYGQIETVQESEDAIGEPEMGDEDERKSMGRATSSLSPLPPVGAQ